MSPSRPLAGSRDEPTGCAAPRSSGSRSLELRGAALDDVLARSVYLHLPPYTVQGTFSGMRTFPPAQCAEPEGPIWDEELRRLEKFISPGFITVSWIRLGFIPHCPLTPLLA
ncbi:hypothetical protein AURDEDRAFT_172894 [Auricularia subglabra TFB-10046 SS5]|nr:hypothetical protein AURDEDRAFT_172894 [Auricularia subglabra TFB-10046 SS5]